MTRRETVRFVPDARRVITKPFVPREEEFADGSTRLQVMLGRIMAMSDQVATATLHGTRELFAGRHRDLDAVFERNFGHMEGRLGEAGIDPDELSTERRHLIGAYFTHEFSIQAAALGNPSIVPAPDQSGLAAGEVRFVMSLRAIGEGHLSSIEFRTGVIGVDAAVHVDTPSDFATTGQVTSDEHHKDLFATKLAELGMINEIEARVLSRLPDRFTMADLDVAIAALEDDGVEQSISIETTHVMYWLASSNYRTSFPSSIEISERVLFPSRPAESRGMEDARFVRFVDDDGTVTYFATYTAFDGHQILPQLIETADLVEFRMSTLRGSAARNKGIAIFPRRIDGRYVALGRHDNVNNFIMMSDDVRVWPEATIIQEPERPWELMQLGNCGSPLETDAGWLVITHGVGAMRRYTLGALLLDLDDPTRVIGHLAEPLLSPAADEREGYVPNVVYSCGSMIHAGHLVLPYGYADVGTKLATIPLDELLDRLSG
ncbi:MAG: hypothetical protein EA389_05975 [Ilumatobacter sp.]|nr:MAG: hypothetical protein EA389_05975 [Ilumatobacter sp.]